MPAPGVDCGLRSVNACEASPTVLPSPPSTLARARFSMIVLPVSTGVGWMVKVSTTAEADVAPNFSARRRPDASPRPALAEMVTEGVCTPAATTTLSRTATSIGMP
eukprot:scaffold30352_cov55-Phaeocystis_antarctica.AAC.1